MLIDFLDSRSKANDKTSVLKVETDAIKDKFVKLLLIMSNAYSSYFHTGHPANLCNKLMLKQLLRSRAGKGVM